MAFNPDQQQLIAQALMKVGSGASTTSPLAAVLGNVGGVFLGSNALQQKDQEQKDMVAKLLAEPDYTKRATLATESDDPAIQKAAFTALLAKPQGPYSDAGKVQADIAAGRLPTNVGTAVLNKMSANDLTPYQQAQLGVQKANLDIRQGANPSYFVKKQIEGSAKEVNDLQKQADGAEKGIQDIGMMRNALNDAGYTGFGGDAYNVADKALLGSLPGSVSSRETANSLGTSLKLGFTSLTKGAISDYEQKMFNAATPGLGTTGLGNKKILDAMEAGHQRVISKAQFFSTWNNITGGNITGARQAWNKFMSDNPIIDKDFNTKPENIDKWQEYLPGGEKGSPVPNGGASQDNPNMDLPGSTRPMTDSENAVGAVPSYVTKSQPPTQNIGEGQTATNQKTGQKVVFRNGQWMPLQ